ncbi:MAG: STAS domain-containing protein [Gammaproteobacteria bacterium]
MKERDCLIVSVQSAHSDTALSSLGIRIAKRLAEYKPSVAVLDLTGMDVIDSFSVQVLRRLRNIFRLYGVKIAISGIQPEVAISMSLRDFDIENVYMAIDLTDALSFLDKSLVKSDGSRNSTGRVSRHG